MLKFNVGQTYICTETKMRYWTVGKEYPVQLRTGRNPCIVDDEGVGWYPDAYEMYATFKLKEENKMTILKRYKCIKSNDEKRFAVGAVYPLYKSEKNYIVANNNTLWYEDEFPIIEKEYGVLLKLIEEHPIPVYTKDDLAKDALETTCTLTQIRKAIVKAYQLYDNDSQRLAYLKGYFDK